MNEVMNEVWKEYAISWMDNYYENGGSICSRCPGNHYEQDTNAGWCLFAEEGRVLECLAMPDELSIKLKHTNIGDL